MHTMACIEVRGQLAGVGSLLHSQVLGTKQVIKLGSNHFYQPSYPTGPVFFYDFYVCVCLYEGIGSP